MKRIPATYDPLGPDTPAWELADRAIDAWHAFIQSGAKTRDAQGRVNADYRRYTNSRQRMLVQVRRHGGDPQAWSDQLRTLCDAPPNE